MADQWEDAAKQYKPGGTPAPAPSASSGNDDWKLWQNSDNSDQRPIGEQPVNWKDPLGTVAKTARVMGGQAIEGGKGILKGAGRELYGLATSPFTPGGSSLKKAAEITGVDKRITGATEPHGTAQTVGSYIPDAVSMLLPGPDLVPSTERAGAGFEQVMNAVGRHTPVNIDAAAPAALRAQELKNAGFARPAALKTVRDLVAPGADQPTFRMVNDLTTNLGSMSAKDAMRLKGPMKAVGTEAFGALRKAGTDAAEQAGVGDLYKGSIGQYRQAKKLENAVEAAKKIGGRAALTAAGVGSGYGLARKLTGE